MNGTLDAPGIFFTTATFDMARIYFCNGQKKIREHRENAMEIDKKKMGNKAVLGFISD